MTGFVFINLLLFAFSSISQVCVAWAELSGIIFPLLIWSNCLQAQIRCAADHLGQCRTHAPGPESEIESEVGR